MKTKLVRIGPGRRNLVEVPTPAPRGRIPLPPPCAHLGKPTGITRTCPSCTGDTQVPLRQCAVHGSCTENSLLPQVQCCLICPDRTQAPALVRTPLLPLRTVRIGPAGLEPGQAFNPSIIDHNGRLLCCYRTGWSGSRLWLTELDRESYQPVSASLPLDLRHPLCTGGREDPRLFSFQGNLLLQFSGVRVANGKTTVQVLYARITDAGEVLNVWHPECAASSEWEKNWQPFGVSEQLYAIHRMQPHTILRLTGDRAEVAHRHTTVLHWRGPGELRGGAPPVRVGDEFWCWFHATDRTQKPALYTTGVATFAAEPPFQWKRITPIPVLWPESSDLPPGWWAQVVFPGGAVLRGQTWSVACGYHDHEARVYEFDHTAIEERLVPV